MPYIISNFFSDKRLSVLWLIIRLYVGWQWFEAGLEKVQSSSWVGDKAGLAIGGFLTNALTKTSGAHPDVQAWYGFFIKDFVLPNKVIFSYLVAYGELLVGIALILGIVTGVAAFFGAFMNMNYLLAGTVSTNPLLLLLEIPLILAWKTAGWIGLDRFVLPRLKISPKSGKVSKK
ncbi:MAG: DoxX family protein [Candidatus Levybacteria bacterium CG10_big_fil_rev_8_21_14_0_10_35_13]|nr:MAG: DoxX family protein [Candidatus Levybacteria bacterium CG10_big_fil_rev_8_21_14_0_10_35_13]